MASALRRPVPVEGSAFRPRGWQRLFLRPRVAGFVSTQFARLYYGRVESTVFGTSYLGIQTLKYPTDLWTYQEIVSETLPELIIETGTWHGGSALYLANVCDALGRGRVITIDTAPGSPLPEHPRVTYIRGSSTDPEVVAAVEAHARQADGVMVILDADHAREHVLQELRTYAPLVTLGGYLIVEDTNVNGNPVLPEHGPGPAEALREFMAGDSRYAVDGTRERLLITSNPGGYLRRVA